MTAVRPACSWCRSPLPARRRRFCSDLCRQRGQRTERVTETGEFGQAAIRMIKTMARRVGASDIGEFGCVFEVMQAAERAVMKTVDDLRAAGFSWTEIAAEVGWSKQRLQQWRQRRGEFQRQRSVDDRIPYSGTPGWSPGKRSGDPPGPPLTAITTPAASQEAKCASMVARPENGGHR